MQIVKKISTALLAPKAALAQAVKESQSPVFVGRVLGTATAVRKGVTQYGNFFAFIGNFRGVDAAGEIYMSPQLFLPGGYDSLVIEQMGERLNERATGWDATNAVTFAFDVYASKSKGELGYQYSLSPAGEFVDPMAEAMAKLAPMPVRAALPAPTQETLEQTEAPTQETLEQTEAPKKGKGK